MWDTLGDGRRLSIYHEATLDERDLRHEKYNVDVAKWTRKVSFWTAWDAACISFSRDPEKVAQAIEEIAQFDDVFEDGKSARLQDDISNLCDLIERAQKADYLTEHFFRIEKYVEWAKRTGVKLPPFIAHQLKEADAERVRWEAHRDLPNKEPQEGAGLRPKLENSYLKIIAELWQMVEQDKKPMTPKELTETIGASLDQKAKKNEAFKLGDETIRKHLVAAYDRFKKISPK
jgi:hypothetical protein